MPTLDDMAKFISDNWENIADHQDKIRNIRDPKIKDMFMERGEKGRYFNGVQIDECVAAAEQWIKGLQEQTTPESSYSSLNNEMEENELKEEGCFSEDSRARSKEGGTVCHPSETNPELYRFRLPQCNRCDMREDPCIERNIAKETR